MAGRYAAGGEAAASRTVLAVIDMQRVFADPDSPWATPRFAEVVGPVRRLVEAYAPDVVFTRFVAPAEPVGAWRAYYDDWPFALQPPDAELWALVPELDPAVTGLQVGGVDGRGAPLDAPTFSKWGTDLARLVGPEGRLVLAGVSTDCCVNSTALAAADTGVAVEVVAEACAGVDDSSHAQALHVLGLYAPLVRVVSLDEALASAPRTGEDAGAVGAGAGAADAGAADAGVVGADPSEATDPSEGTAAQDAGAGQAGGTDEAGDG